MQECAAYESGVVLSRNSILVQDILVNPKKSNEAKEWLDCQCAKFDRKLRYDLLNPAGLIIVLYYDLEIGGLKKDAEVLQVSITAANPSNHPSEISLYVLPTKKFDSTPTNVQGLSVSCATGQKTLADKYGKFLPATSLQNAAEEVSQFLHKMKSNNEQLLSVVHNGHTFDQNRFLNFIHEASASEYLDKTILHEIVLNSRQLSSIWKTALFELREKQNEQELLQLLKLDTQRKWRNWVF